MEEKEQRIILAVDDDADILSLLRMILESHGYKFLGVNRGYKALKVAEDGKDIILRVYEDQNRRGKCSIKFFKAPGSAFECDPFERETGQADIISGELQFDIKPFEIKTFRLSFNN